MDDVIVLLLFRSFLHLDFQAYVALYCYANWHLTGFIFGNCILFCIRYQTVDFKTY